MAEKYIAEHHTELLAQAIGAVEPSTGASEVLGERATGMEAQA